MPADAFEMARQPIAAFTLVHVVLRGRSDSEIVPLAIQAVAILMVNFHLAVGDSADETVHVHRALVLLSVGVDGVPVSVGTPAASRHTFKVGIVHKGDEALSQLDCFHNGSATEKRCGV